MSPKIRISIILCAYRVVAFISPPTDRKAGRVLLSIITVNKNDVLGLHRTHESLKGQTFWDDVVEWIVIDGASNDGSQEVPTTSSLTNVRLHSDADSGIYDAMNKGLRAASGRYVLFLNAGDELASQTVLERAQVVLSSIGTEAVLLGDWLLRLPGTRPPHERRARGDRYLRHSLPTSHQAMFFPMSRLKDFEYDTTYRIAGDYYIAAWLFTRGVPFRRLHFPVAIFGAGGTSHAHPWLLVVEAARVQRRVLGLSTVSVIISAVIRCASYLRLSAFQWWARRSG